MFRRAKLLLKKKRYLESLLDKTDTQLDNLEQMVENIEFTQIEMKVVEGLKQGNECLEEMHKVCFHTSYIKYGADLVFPDSFIPSMTCDCEAVARYMAS